VSAILRPYQAHIAAEFERLVAQGKRRVIVVAPTGSGKTVIACAIIAATPRRVLVISHRREIVNQTSAKLTGCGVPHGIIQAGDEKKLVQAILDEAFADADFRPLHAEVA
jgi:DNA repair protein RadD